jgi:hypothetical protein
MGLIIQQRALQAASGLRPVLPVVRKREGSFRIGVRLSQGGARRSSARGGLRIRTHHEGQRGGHRAR